MDKKNILIPDRSNELSVEKSVFGPDYKINLENASEVSEISDDTWASCDGILCWHDLVFSKKIISKLKK